MLPFLELTRFLQPWGIVNHLSGNAINSEHAFRGIESIAHLEGPRRRVALHRLSDPPSFIWPSIVYVALHRLCGPPSFMMSLLRAGGAKRRDVHSPSLRWGLTVRGPQDQGTSLCLISGVFSSDRVVADMSGACPVAGKDG